MRLPCVRCSVSEIVKKNLLFLIGIRHEIEHQMITRIDDQMSAKFQAAALNFNAEIKKLFGEKYSLDSEQAFSIQFSGIDEGSAKELMAQPDLPQHIRSFVVQFENDMTQAEFDDPRFSYRVAFVRKRATAKQSPTRSFSSFHREPTQPQKSTEYSSKRPRKRNSALAPSSSR
jgi:hypothetical protein